MADANSSCEISERGKRRHRRKQNAKGRKKQMPNCLQRLPTRRNLDVQITNGPRQISRDVEIWRRNLKRLQIILGHITPCDLVFPSMTSCDHTDQRAETAVVCGVRGPGEGRVACRATHCTRAVAGRDPAFDIMLNKTTKRFTKRNKSQGL